MNKDTELLMGAYSAAADIQRQIIHQATSGKSTISQDRRNDIIRAAKLIIAKAEKLS